MKGLQEGPSPVLCKRYHLSILSSISALQKRGDGEQAFVDCYSGFIARGGPSTKGRIFGGGGETFDQTREWRDRFELRPGRYPRKGKGNAGRVS